MKELQELRRELEKAVVPGDEAVVDRALTLFEQLARRCDRLEKENRRLAQRVRELEGDEPPQSPPPEPSSYSVDAEDKRRRRRLARLRGRKKKAQRPGRKPKKDKLDSVVRWVDVVPEGSRAEDCELQSERIVWRIEGGRAVRVGYRVHRLAWGETPRAPGVLPRCEHGVEIHVMLAYLVYVVGVSIDKACQLLRFFCGLPLAPSQADALLAQLGRHWGEQFDEICDRIVLAAVVYADETSWRVGRLRTSLWAFTSDSLCVMLFGCSKDRATLESMLPPETFAGTLVSDDASVYRDGYRSQKCWAHLLRKAIRLALLHPGHPTYRSFLDHLLEIYGDALRAAADQRLGDRGRRRRESELVARLCDLCHPHWTAITPGLPEPSGEAERDFHRLINELMRLVADEQLFAFVLDPRVDPTNNLSERQLRSPALARKANRTNKTDAGARRQTVIVSVLESLRRSLDDFTIDSVVAQVADCLARGIGMFQPTGPPADPAPSPAG